MSRFDDRVKEIDKWWADRRFNYNKGLVLSGFAAFIVYSLVGSSLIPDFEITLFTIFFQSIGYVIMILIANVFYDLGELIDLNHNENGKKDFRNRSYQIGFWFSCALPFSIPLLLLFSRLKCK